MSRVKVILNPQAGHGHAARLSAGICDYFVGHDVDFEMVHTEAPGHAIELAQQAVDEGFEKIVSVGGDGTSHEIVNGLMARANGEPVGTLGWIPAGSGNDFAVMNGAPVDMERACNLIVQGGTRLVDVGRVTIDGEITRYFDNAVGIGLDSLVVKETHKLQWLRGMALYLPAVLKTVFLTLKPIRATLTIDGKVSHSSHLMIVVANGPREGGAFLVAPEAHCNDGFFDVVMAGWMSRLSMLAMIPRFLKGTHLRDPRITVRQARHILIQSEEPLHTHVDGEILTEHAHEIELEMLPHALRVISPPERHC